MRMRTAAMAAVCSCLGALPCHAETPTERPRQRQVLRVAQLPLQPGLEALAYLPEGRAVVAAEPAAKDSGRLWSVAEAVTPALHNAIGAQLLRVDLPVVVGFVPGMDFEEVFEALAGAGADVRWATETSRVPQVGIVLPAARAQALGSLLRRHDGAVLFADLQPGARLQNGRSAWLCQSGEPGVTPIYEHGIFGQDQVIALMDTGVDPGSCFFSDEQAGLPAVNDAAGVAVDPAQRKVLAVDFWWDEDWPDPGVFGWDSHGHGSHTAGSAAGDHDADGGHGANDGMAPAARLVIQDGGYQVDPCGDLPGLGCPMRPLEPMLAQAYQQGARIHSNSWGDEEDSWPLNRYTERTADLDRFVWQHPDMLVVAAAGNAGGWGVDTVISPSTGKNVLSVGATWQADINPVCRADFSSLGWSHDGRIKPDVLAPGSNISSAATDGRSDTSLCTERFSSGTSMAAPTAAGLAALVRQYFEEGWHARGWRDDTLGFGPSAALVKATLIASAIDLREQGCPTVGPIPSREQGWGLIRLERALWFAGDSHRLSVVDRPEAFGAAGTGEHHVLRGLAGGPLKVVLAWTDPPSTAVAETNLVNDLDLEVRGPSGSVWMGNVFANGVSVVGGSADRTNNVEVVWLPDAEAGTWTVSVWAHGIPVPDQGYALAIVRPVAEPGARDAREAGRAGP
jgi:subtilisin family serine protease